MDAREERGLVIAALCKLNKKRDNEWIVPSQSGIEKVYTVDPIAKTCTCPDHSENGHKCKHLFAVEIVQKREFLPDGTCIDTQSVTFTKKTVYKQNWEAYNEAQSIEKDRMQELLYDLCQHVQEPPAPRVGRRPHRAKDAIFAMTLKVYSLFSARRFSSDLREAYTRGHVTKPIPGMKVNCFLENPSFTPILKQLIAQSALPLKTVERDFAIDSSGFGTSVFETWYDAKYGVTRRKCLWVKTHLACGVKTNIVTAVRILDKAAADAPQFVPLLRETKRGFEIGEVSADKAYASLENFEEVAACGGTGFIAFKANTTGAVGGMFQKMFAYFLYKQDEYMQRYHKRSNVESTFSMIKRKFGHNVRAMTPTAQVNEVLCKILCHNLCVLVQEECELGIKPMFEAPKPQQMIIAN